MILTGAIGKDTPGLKRRIAQYLESLGEGSTTMGELIAGVGIDKTLASDVSSALYKLSKQGLITVFDGPASSNMGRRTVRRYRWVKQEPAKWTPVQEVRYDALRMLGMRKL